MSNFKQVNALVVVALVFVLSTLSGCSSAVRAIKNKDLAVEAKMSDTIFLEAETLAEAMPAQGGNGAIFVRVANTSDFQDVDFKNIINGKLNQMGFKVTQSPKEASYSVAANLLYMGEKKEGIDGDAILAAGFGGAVIGASASAVTGSNWQRAGAAGLIAGAAAAGGEALVGGIFHVDEYLGVIDIQIKEEVAGGVKGAQDAEMTNGINTNIKTTRNIASDKQEYRTRIVVKAKQTRMDRAEAVGVISDRLGSQISGLFKM